MDGGLERLVRLLRDFCAQPPPPESPSQFYGLLPPTTTPKLPNLTTSMQAPYDPKRPFDRAAAYRFSLAFQCVVNIGVRGSESIRARVVQAGTLDVVGCVLEAWLASKGFAVGPSASASGMPRETREQRHARRLAMAEMRQREIQAQEIARVLQRQVAGVRRIDEVRADAPLCRFRTDFEQDEEMPDVSSERDPPDDPDAAAAFVSSFLRSSPSPSPHPRAAASDTSNDTSPTSTPHGGSTPTRAVVVPGRDRSGTVVARTTTSTTPTADSYRTRRRSTLRPTPAPAPTTNTRTDTEPDSDADAEMEDASASSPGSTPGPVPVPVPVSASPSASASASAPGPTPPQQQQQQHRAVGIVGDDDTAALDVGMNLNILLAGVDDGFVALEQNVGDDMAMGAPPGAPGNMDMGVGVPQGDRSPRIGMEERREVEDLTPRAGFVALPDTHTHQHQTHQHPLQHAFTHPHPTLHPHTQHHHHPLVPAHHRPQGTLPPHPHPHTHPTTHAPPTQAHAHPHPHAHTHIEEPGPYREEDVLLSLQLLAYLSKYPHVRQAFYKPREVFNPALQVSLVVVKLAFSNAP